MALEQTACCQETLHMASALGHVLCREAGQGGDGRNGRAGSGEPVQLLRQWACLSYRGLDVTADQRGPGRECIHAGCQCGGSELVGGTWQNSGLTAGRVPCSPRA